MVITKGLLKLLLLVSLCLWIDSPPHAVIFMRMVDRLLIGSIMYVTTYLYLIRPFHSNSIPFTKPRKQTKPIANAQKKPHSSPAKKNPCPPSNPKKYPPPNPPKRKPTFLSSKMPSSATQKRKSRLISERSS